MGAWGYEPFANDEALDWLGSKVQGPITDAIRRTLLGFLKQKYRRQRRFKVPLGHRHLWEGGYPGGHHEAIGAAALLDELTPYEKAKRPARSGIFRKGDIMQVRVSGTTLGLHYEAEDLHLYSLAVRALDAILKNDLGWIGSWSNPMTACYTVRGLRDQLAEKIPRERPVRPKGHRERGWRRRASRRLKNPRRARQRAKVLKLKK